MLAIEKVDHIGIRISDKTRSIAFYQLLGFELISDKGYEAGHPIIMQHPSGDVINLLGPASSTTKKNILMDVEETHTGITHVSYKVTSIDDTKRFFKIHGIEITGEFHYQDLHAVFVRDPDRNVIELDAYDGKEPKTRTRLQSDPNINHQSEN